MVAELENSWQRAVRIIWLLASGRGCCLVTRPCVDGGDGAPSSGYWASFGRGDGESRRSSERLVRVVDMRKMVTSRL